MDIVTLGELLIDMFPDQVGRRMSEVEAFRPKAGGAPANVAVAARRLGAETAFIGKVGDDLFGHMLRDVLKHEGVETRGIRFADDARTTMAIIAKPDPDTAEFVFYRNPGADQQLRASELDHALLEETKAFHFGSLSLTDEPAAGATLKAKELARKHGALISYDVNYRPSLWTSPRIALAMASAMLPQVDLLKVNEAELALLSGKEVDHNDDAVLEAACRVLLGEGPTAIVVTLGRDGSFFCVADGAGRVQPFKVTTVDAVGCGDTFIAALLTRIVTGYDDWRAGLTVETLPDAIGYANAAAAITATREGVIPALPTADEVTDFMNNSDM